MSTGSPVANFCDFYRFFHPEANMISLLLRGLQLTAFALRGSLRKLVQASWAGEPIIVPVL